MVTGLWAAGWAAEAYRTHRRTRCMPRGPRARHERRHVHAEHDADEYADDEHAAADAEGHASLPGGMMPAMYDPMAPHMGHHMSAMGSMPMGMTGMAGVQGVTWAAAATAVKAAAVEVGGGRGSRTVADESFGNEGPSRPATDKPGSRGSRHRRLRSSRGAKSGRCRRWCVVVVALFLYHDDYC